MFTYFRVTMVLSLGIPRAAAKWNYYCKKPSIRMVFSFLTVVYLREVRSSKVDCWVYSAAIEVKPILLIDLVRP